MRAPMQPAAFFATLLSFAIGMPSIAAAQDDLRARGTVGTGTATLRACPQSAVMTGMRARVGLAIDAVGLRCRPIQANGTLGAESNAGSLAGGTGGTERTRSCPTGTVVVGQRISNTWVAPSGHRTPLPLMERGNPQHIRQYCPRRRRHVAAPGPGMTCVPPPNVRS